TWKEQMNSSSNSISSSISSWALFAIALSLSACTTVIPLPALNPDPSAACANIDWYETGRVDGTLGFSISKLDEYQTRCNETPYPVHVELYTNGRDAGLTEFCTPTTGFEAGRRGSDYTGVCPYPMEERFITHFRIG